MGRVTRLIERRQLRRAAEQALTTPAFLRPLDRPTADPGRAVPVDASEGLDRGADHPDTASPESDDAVTVPIPLAALNEQLDDACDDLEFNDDPALTPIAVWTPDPFERSHFRVAKPWYRSTVAAVMGVAAAALVLSTVLLLSRGSESEHATGVAADASTATSPRQTTALPTLSSGAPLLSNTPPAPPPPPPPPPSSASPTPAWRDNESWKPSPPSPTKKPEVNVTRAPMSVAPRALPPPSSAPPGGGHGWHFGF